MPKPNGQPRELVFTDTETTGIHDEAQIIELAFAAGDQFGHHGVLPHTLQGADRKALEVNRYWERELRDETPDPELVSEFAHTAAENILVGANIRYDARKLEKLIGCETWHYRLGDIESAAWLLLGFEEPPGLHTLRARLTELGYDIPAPDHTAKGDVETTRACFRVLQRIARLLLSNGIPGAEELKMFEDVMSRTDRLDPLRPAAS